MGDTVSSLLFQPPPPSKLKEHKIVWLNTRRGSRIPGFYISYRRQAGVESCRSLSAEEIKDSQPDEGITILYSHANAEDLGSIYPWCKFLSKMLQVNLFAYDYSGYGMGMKHGEFLSFAFHKSPASPKHPLTYFFRFTIKVRRRKNIATPILKPHMII
jgi:hypothetical protein